MQDIILATGLVAGSGLILGVILAVFSKVMAVPVDVRQKEMREMLPGANCGACGHNTCDGYSEALANGTEKQTNLCKPGGAEVAGKLSDYLGVEFTGMTATTATVMCRGDRAMTAKRAEYVGIETCHMAAQVEGGDATCLYGCLGYGDCEQVCQYDAVHVVNGLAIVDPAKCTSCGMCIAACPKKIIELLPLEKAISVVICKNEDKGALANKVCKASCIACRRCVKACPENCIEIKNNRAIIDYALCTHCGECQKVCPHDCIMSLLPFGTEGLDREAVTIHNGVID